MSDLAAPVRLEADGKPINIGELSSSDLLVNDFPAFFWHFDNVGSDRAPQSTSAGKLQAGNTDAKTPESSWTIDVNHTDPWRKGRQWLELRVEGQSQRQSR